jgi:hypothetical protein
MLVFANPMLGLYSWNEKKYLLSTPEAVVQFVNDPDE